VDLRQLHEEIRAEASRQRARAAAVIPLPDKNPGRWCLNWLEVKGRVRGATDLAEAGLPPGLNRAPGVRRWLAGLLSRVVLRVTRFITSRQTGYNVALLDLVRDTAEALHEVETRLREQEERVRQLEATLAQVQLGRAGTPPAGRKAS
jgi:hypothetical protein